MEPKAGEHRSATTRALLDSYYAALSTGRDWGRPLSDGFLLSGTVAKETRGRDLYVGNGFFKMVKGLKVKELMVEGDTGFAIVGYDLVSPRGRPFKCDVAEFWRAKDGMLVSVSIYFDTAAFGVSVAQ
jgi:hypothetical protein